MVLLHGAKLIPTCVELVLGWQRLNVHYFYDWSMEMWRPWKVIVIYGEWPLWLSFVTKIHINLVPFNLRGAFQLHGRETPPLPLFCRQHFIRFLGVGPTLKYWIQIVSIAVLYGLQFYLFLVNIRYLIHLHYALNFSWI